MHNGPTGTNSSWRRSLRWPISQEIEEHSGDDVALFSVYTALEGLQDLGFVSSIAGEPTPERGSAKKYFKFTGKGMKVVQETQQMLTRLWKGLPKLQGGKV